MRHYQVYQAQFFVNSGTVSEVRGAFLQLTGYSRENLLNQNFHTVLKVLLKATIELSSLKPGLAPVNCYIFTRNMQAREVRISAHTLHNSGGICYRVKETPGVRLNKKVIDVEKIFTDNQTGACILSSPELFVLKANTYFLDLVGSRSFENPHDALGLQLYDLVALESLPGMKSDLTKVIQTGKSVYSSRMISFTRKKFCSINLIPIKEKQRTKYILGIFKDTSDYAMEMEKSKERKRQLEVILENMNDGLIITDNRANVIMMNAAARAYYKEPDNMKALDTCFNKVVATDMDGNPIPYEDLPAHRALRGERVKNYRIIFNRSTGQKIFEYNSSPLYDSDGNIVMTISCSRDVTDQVQSEKVLKAKQEELFRVELEKNEALRKAIDLKDEFLSLISHEFKTPISVIIAAAQAIETLCGDQLNDKAKLYIKRIRQNAYRQLRLVNNLLEITRVSSGQVKLHVKNYDIVFLSSSITESVVPYADQKGVKLSFSSSVNKKIISIDDEKYERILLNLLSNAIKFTPSGKSIFVRISEKKDMNGNQVCIEVEDEGTGIPEEKQEMIFEKFEQVDNMQTPGSGGTGLGLSLVKLYVEVLGGSISLKSQVGQGTCFTLLLPDKQLDIVESVAEAAVYGSSHPIQRVAIEFSDLYPLE